MSFPNRKLGELCKVSGGNSAPQDQESFFSGTIPFVRMKDLGRYHLTTNLIDTNDKLTKDVIVTKRIRLFEPGSILFPRSGSVALNHRAILGVQAAIVSHIGILENFSKEIEPHYLYWFLLTVDMKRLAKKTTGVDSISFSDVRDIDVPVPSISDQRRIIDILSRAEGIVRLRREAQKKATEIIPALFLDMFGDPTTNPKGWPIQVLDEIITDGPQNGLYKHVSLYGEGTPILRIDAFYDGRVLSLSKLKRVRLTPDEHQKFKLRERDIVINRVNSPEYLGKSTIVPPLKEETVFESNMMKFSVNDMATIPEYLIEFLQTSHTKAYFLAKAKHAINQSSINQQDVKSLPVTIPPVENQTEFVDRVEQIRSIQSQQVIATAKAEAIFNALLAQFFIWDRRFT